MIRIMKRMLHLLFLISVILHGPEGLRIPQAAEIEQEYQVKAAFLVNFARFITWPEQSLPSGEKVFTLCVIGENPFGEALRTVANKRIHSRELKIVYADSLDEMPSCCMVYVSRSERHALKPIFARLGQRAVVTVSDLPGFVDDGGAIEFVTKGERLAFLINNYSLNQRGLEVSASMLDLAAGVR